MDGPFDVLVVGAGCAGMRAAIEAHDAGARRCCRVGGGFTRRGATPERPKAGSTLPSGTRRTTIPRPTHSTRSRGPDYIGDQDAIEIFTREAPGDIYQLEGWGCVFSRNAEGKLDQRL